MLCKNFYLLLTITKCLLEITETAITHVQFRNKMQDLHTQFKQSHNADHLLSISIAGNAQFQILRYRCPADRSRSVDNAKMTRHADGCRHRRGRRQSQHASYTVLLSQHLQTR